MDPSRLVYENRLLLALLALKTGTRTKIPTLQCLQTVFLPWGELYSHDRPRETSLFSTHLFSSRTGRPRSFIIITECQELFYLIFMKRTSPLDRPVVIAGSAP